MLWLTDIGPRMKVTLASIAGRAGTGPAQSLLEQYTGRIAAYVPLETTLVRSEAAFFESMARLRTRTQPLLVLLDSRGKQLRSEELAEWVRTQQERGQQAVVFAIGPADGWSTEARSQAGLLLSLGPMTLPHELARVVLAEQVYRAFTILAGHPYHSGH